MNINWFPGHMNKAVKQIREKLKLVDLCLEVLDARIPESSRNHMLEKVTNTKPLMVVLNKADMADPNETQRWVDSFEKKGIPALAMNAQKDRKTDLIYQKALSLVEEKKKRLEAKGVQNAEIRMMVFGIPNSGKSTFINNVAKRRGAKVGNRPGITQSQQWIKTTQNLMLMDTPGILWQKLEKTQSLHLAYTGAIRDEVLPLQDVGFSFIKDVLKRKEDLFFERYGVDEKDPLAIMEAIAEKYGKKQKSGYIDYDQVARMLLEDFRKMRLGRFTLEVYSDAT